MQSFDVVHVLLALLHLLLAVQALRVAARKRKWSGSKLSFAKFAAVFVPLLGPLLIFIALAPASPGDPNLQNNIEVLHERP